MWKNLYLLLFIITKNKASHNIALDFQLLTYKRLEFSIGTLSNITNNYQLKLHITGELQCFKYLNIYTQKSLTKENDFLFGICIPFQKIKIIINLYAKSVNIQLKWQLYKNINISYMYIHDKNNLYTKNQEFSNQLTPIKSTTPGSSLDDSCFDLYTTNITPLSNCINVINHTPLFNSINTINNIKTDFIPILELFRYKYNKFEIGSLLKENEEFLEYYYNTQLAINLLYANQNNINYKGKKVSKEEAIKAFETFNKLVVPEKQQLKFCFQQILNSELNQNSPELITIFKNNEKIKEILTFNPQNWLSLDDNIKNSIINIIINIFTESVIQLKKIKIIKDIKEDSKEEIERSETKEEIEISEIKEEIEIPLKQRIRTLQINKNTIFVLATGFRKQTQAGYSIGLDLARKLVHFDQTINFLYHSSENKKFKNRTITEIQAKESLKKAIQYLENNVFDNKKVKEIITILLRNSCNFKDKKILQQMQTNPFLKDFPNNNQSFYDLTIKEQENIINKLTILLTKIIDELKFISKDYLKN